MRMFPTFVCMCVRSSLCVCVRMCVYVDGKSKATGAHNEFVNQVTFDFATSCGFRACHSSVCSCEYV